jgi:hypothetical protein
MAEDVSSINSALRRRRFVATRNAAHISVGGRFPGAGEQATKLVAINGRSVII